MKPIDIIKNAMEELNEYFHESGKEQLEEEQIDKFATNLLSKLPKLDKLGVEEILIKYHIFDGFYRSQENFNELVGKILSLTPQPKYNKGAIEKILYDCVLENEEEYPVKEILEKYAEKLSSLPEQSDNERTSDEILVDEIHDAEPTKEMKENWERFKQSDNEKVIAEGRVGMNLDCLGEYFIGNKDDEDITLAITEYDGTKVQLILKQIK